MPVKKKRTKKALKIKGKGIFGDIYNGIAGLVDSTVRKGELHIPQLTTSGIKFAQYAGPKTDILGRLRDKVQPINEIDKISQLHDINYTLNGTQQGIRDADWRMVKTGAKSAVQNLLKGNVLDTINSGIGSLGILSKIGLESVGLSAYKPENMDLKNSDKAMLLQKKQELENEGYGKKKRGIPKKK